MTTLYKRILIPTDGSACGELGVRQGLELARVFGSDVLFLHVIESISPPIHAGIPSQHAFEKQVDAARQSGAAALETARRLALENAVTAKSELAEPAEAAGVIVEACEREACDLIVMSSHGRSGFRRLVLGSVTESVLRRTSKPLFVVRCTENSS